MKTAPPQDTTTLLYQLADRACARYPQRLRDDLRQEAVLAGLRALDSFDSARGSMHGYLLRCMRNHLLNLARKEIRTVYATVPLEDHHDVATEPEEPLEYTVTYVQLNDAIAQLLPQQQQLIDAIYLENRSFCDVARGEGRSYQSVQQRHERVLRALRARIAHEPTMTT